MVWNRRNRFSKRLNIEEQSLEGMKRCKLVATGVVYKSEYGVD